MNLKSRHLVIKENQIVLAPSAQVAGSFLCDFCSLKNGPCKGTEEQDCVDFTPGIGFAPPILGIEGKFSTFRASGIWYKRAKILYSTHARIGIYNTATLERITIGKITGAFRGPFESLMHRHAHTNHLVQAAGISAEEAPTWLPRKIRNLAGSRYVKSPQQICTVINIECETTPVSPV